MRRLILMALTLSVSGQSTPTLAELSNGVAELWVRLRATEAKLLEAEKRIKDLSFQQAVSSLDIAKLPPASAKFNVGDMGFVIARTNIGPIAIGLGEAAPYPGGHKLAIQVFPLHSATMTGAAIKISYSRLRKDGESLLLWENQRKVRETDQVYTLPSGQWTKVEVVLPGAREEDMMFFEVEVTSRGIVSPFPLAR